jgi:mRNA-degrading endonuclease RelE of RelBE toxin-antitoxin system
MRVIIDDEAQCVLREMPKVDVARITAALRQVADLHPQRLSFVTELVGRPGVWRLRKGNFRAVCSFDDDSMIVFEIGGARRFFDERRATQDRRSGCHDRDA